MPRRANSGGRPVGYDPAYCQAVIGHMGQGFSLTAFAGDIGVARSTVEAWIDEHPDFAQAVEIGRAKRTAALERTLLAAETGPKVTAHVLALKRAAPEEWTDEVYDGTGPQRAAAPSRIEMVIVDPKA
jgi:transposase